jgi:cyclophilin family peptidyl-prolyl cis-trans isomerase
MRFLVFFVFALCSLAVATTQVAFGLGTLHPQGAQAGVYRSKPGETVLKVEIEGRGDIYVKLFTKEAPKTTGHILKLVRDGFYDGQRFHRVETSPKPYLVQIGDPASKGGDLTGNGGSGARIEYEESGYSNETGSVGLSRPRNDPGGGDSQFYILYERASFLDGNYTVFGKVVSGMDVVRKIQRGDRVIRVTAMAG